MSRPRKFSPSDIETAFWKRVALTGYGGCWQWLGKKNEKGYGILYTHHTENLKAHRYSYEIFNGEPVPDGMLLRHSCDNPSCVNPDHLIPGTPLENSTDMVVRGRCRTGENHPNARLTDAEVEQVKDLLSRNFKRSDIVARFNTSPMTVSRIAKGTHRCK